MERNRPTLLARGNQLFREKPDGTEELLATFHIPGLAKLFAAAPLLEEALQQASPFIARTSALARSYEEEEELGQKQAELEHALRLAGDEELVECCCLDCELSSAPGAQYCEFHVLYFLSSSKCFYCMVRGCEDRLAGHYPVMPLCRPHFDAFEEAGGRRILHWLARQGSNASTEESSSEDNEPIESELGPAIVFGLGDQLIRSGLPVGVDPGPVEEALIAGGSRCTAGTCQKIRLPDRIWCEEHANEIDDQS